MNRRHINQATIDLIKRFEGFRAKAYKCPAGRWTIGYGHTSSAGPPQVKPGMRISRRKAEEILRRDMEKFAVGVAEAIGARSWPNSTTISSARWSASPTTWGSVTSAARRC